VTLLGPADGSSECLLLDFNGLTVLCDVPLYLAATLPHFRPPHCTQGASKQLLHKDIRVSIVPPLAQLPTSIDVIIVTTAMGISGIPWLAEVVDLSGTVVLVPHVAQQLAKLGLVGLVSEAHFRNSVMAVGDDDQADDDADMMQNGDDGCGGVASVHVAYANEWSDVMTPFRLTMDSASHIEGDSGMNSHGEHYKELDTALEHTVWSYPRLVEGWFRDPNRLHGKTLAPGLRGVSYHEKCEVAKGGLKITLTPYSSGLCLGGTHWVIEEASSPLQERVWVVGPAAYRCVYPAPPPAAATQEQQPSAAAAAATSGDVQMKDENGHKDQGDDNEEGKDTSDGTDGPKEEKPPEPVVFTKERPFRGFEAPPYPGKQDDESTWHGEAVVMYGCVAEHTPDQQGGDGVSVAMWEVLESVLATAKKGGNVLIPIDFNWMLAFELLELLLVELSHDPAIWASGSFPVFCVGEGVKEALHAADLSSEWLNEQRVHRALSSDAVNPFAFDQLQQQGKLIVADSLQTLGDRYREPCLMVTFHSSLRLGPATELMPRWAGDPKNLLVCVDPINTPTHLKTPPTTAQGAGGGGGGGSAGLRVPAWLAPYEDIDGGLQMQVLDARRVFDFRVTTNEASQVLNIARAPYVIASHKLRGSSNTTGMSAFLSPGEPLLIPLAPPADPFRPAMLTTTLAADLAPIPIDTLAGLAACHVHGEISHTQQDLFVRKRDARPPPQQQQQQQGAKGDGMAAMPLLFGRVDVTKLLNGLEKLGVRTADVTVTEETTDQHPSGEHHSGSASKVLRVEIPALEALVCVGEGGGCTCVEAMDEEGRDKIKKALMLLLAHVPQGATGGT